MWRKFAFVVSASSVVALAAWLTLRSAHESRSAALPASARNGSEREPASLAPALEGPQAEAPPPGSAAPAERALPPDAARATSPRSGRITVAPSLGMFELTAAFDELASVRAVSESGRVFLPTKCDGPMHACCFDDLPAGHYAVAIQSPSFQVWRKEGVEPGARLEPTLVGSAALRVELTDGASGELVSVYRLEVQPDSRTRQHHRGALRELADPATKEGLYRLPPGDWVATFTKPGFGTLVTEVNALRANEVRTLEIALARPTRIAGHVLDSRGFAPSSPCDVRLYEPAERDDSPQSKYLPTSGSRAIVVEAADWAGAARRETAKTATDSSGAFAFEDVAPGRYFARVWLAPQITATEQLELVAGARIEDLVLRLPPIAFLEGRVLAPAGSSFEGLSLSLDDRTPAGSPRDLDLERTILQGFGKDAIAFALARDGSFRSGPLPVGNVKLGLVFPAMRTPLSNGGYVENEPIREPVAEVALEPGENRIDIDVRELFPGTIEARVFLDGSPAKGACVEVVRGSTPVGAFTDSEGSATLRYVPVGSATLAVWAGDGSWCYRSSEPLDVVAGGRHEARIEIETIEDELSILSGDERLPLAERELGFEAVSERAHSVQSRTTDRAGRLHLRLPPGRYRVLGGDFEDGSTSAEFEWTTSGPVPREVVLAR